VTNGHRSYHHRQQASLCLPLYATATAMFIGAWIARSEFPFPVILVGSGVIMCLLAMAFHHLTVLDQGNRLRCHRGAHQCTLRRWPDCRLATRDREQKMDPATKRAITTIENGLCGGTAYFVGETSWDTSR